MLGIIYNYSHRNIPKNKEFDKIINEITEKFEEESTYFYLNEYFYQYYVNLNKNPYPFFLKKGKHFAVVSSIDSNKYNSLDAIYDLINKIQESLTNKTYDSDNLSCIGFYVNGYFYPFDKEYIDNIKVFREKYLSSIKKSLKSYYIYFSLIVNIFRYSNLIYYNLKYISLELGKYYKLLVTNNKLNIFFY